MIRFFAFDSDGTLFPNTVWEGVEVSSLPLKPKIRSYYDGQGISLMRAVGIRICIITNESGVAAAGVRAAVMKWNALPSCRRGDWPPIDLFEGCGGPCKLEKLKEWLTDCGGTLEECGAMGDDLVDAVMLRAVAFPAAPISSEHVIRELCLDRGGFVSERSAGEGAVRDLANHLVQIMYRKNPLDLPYE